ncbi:hypothetical protein [Jhaorihella thermophila]|uniref:Uncharacterized protein n=1 Tax=Jhaorihella thermophila TaxID=488547 RepID=A0A1H5SLP2_9RHOB|nr:hypothetical protein [Jhaorihella thermophila]SEF51496.1 hypothetical protein SAMN05421751_101612 [Jhaorihella thermophila]
MRNDWILDVLADLKNFASANGLPALAEQLGDTTLVAAAEIASRHLEETGGRVETGGESGPGARGY